jgi:uncharacterized protein (DUF1684 family)
MSKRRISGVMSREPSLDEALAFRESRIARLTAEDGWLTLVARYPIDLGENQLPIGTVTRDERGVVKLTVAPDLTVTYAGQPIRERVLRADGDAGGPDQIIHGRLVYELVRRGEILAVRVRDPGDRRRLEFPGTEWFPLNPDWRLEGQFAPFPEERLIDIPYSISHDLGPVRSRSPGQLVLELAGRSWRLDSLMDDERRRLFILFGDATNRDETYGAGRFLYTPLPDAATGRVAVDFNHALNPACAFTELVACPLPPAQNRFPFRVEAGEKRFRGSAP